jgi:thiamine biosynthesis lipoprotein
MDMVQIQGPAFGASWRVSVAAGADVGAIVSAITGIVASVDAAMSPFQPASEISRFNGTESTDWLALSPATLITLREAKRIAALTQGAFDPTLGGLVGRYGFGPITQHPAGSFNDVALSSNGARKAHAMQTLDLCGIAKGHALDRIIAALTALGQKAFFVELGGEVYGLGLHPDGRPWRAGVERPLSGQRAVQCIVAMSGEALATSGDRVNSYVHGGHRYSHIIDPKRKLPADTLLASVSVFAPHAITADALATALFAMGPFLGHEFAERNRIAALFLLRDGADLREVTTADFSTRIIR